MTYISKGPVIKIIGKAILTIGLYSVAFGLSQRIWR